MQTQGLAFRRPELDVLRFGAFLMVFSCHALAVMLVWHGSTPDLVLVFSRGVDLFFALSAYLITEILLRERRHYGYFSLRNFYVRRILRIWPLYLAFLAFTFWVVPRFSSAERFPWPDRLAFLVFLGNWRFLVPGPFHSVAAILWSVSIEEQFYVSWPLLLRAARSQYIPVCIGLLALGVGYRAVMLSLHAAGWYTEYSTFARFDGIVAGALLAFLLDGEIPQLPPIRAVALLSVGFLAIAGVLVRGWASVFGPTLVAAGCVAILIAAMSLQFRNRALQYLGRISYGLYVFHTTALVVAGRIGQGTGVAVWIFRDTFALAVTIVMAAVSYRWLETPFLRLKERFAVVRQSAAASS